MKKREKSWEDILEMETKFLTASVKSIKIALVNIKKLLKSLDAHVIALREIVEVAQKRQVIERPT